MPVVPSTLDWDSWLGVAAPREFDPAYLPFNWRGFWDFGTGALGDMGCHIIDPAFWALDLGAPTTVEATTTHWEKDVSSQTFPRASIVRYQFPARGTRPPVALTWYDGRLQPPIPADLTKKLIRGEKPQIAVEADATDPATTGPAMNAVTQAVNQTLDIMGQQSAVDAAFGLHHLCHAHNKEVFGTEFYMESYRLLMEVLGPRAYLKGDSPEAIMRSRLEMGIRSSIILTFGGGTNELQRDLIAMFGLGFPRSAR